VGESMTRADRLFRAVRNGGALVADLRSLGLEVAACVVDDIVGALQQVRVREATARLVLANPGDLTERA